MFSIAGFRIWVPLLSTAVYGNLVIRSLGAGSITGG